MDSLIAELMVLRDDARNKGDALQADGYPSDDPRDAFGRIFNHATLSLETLAFYRSAWDRVPAGMSSDEIARAKQENADRMMIVLRHLFVDSMSAIEFACKETLKALPTSPLTRAVMMGGRVYLGNIMEKSEALGLVPSGFRAAWVPMIEVRNMLVHNNGIADKPATYNVGGEKITLVPGRMTQAKPRALLALVQEAMNLYDTWSGSV